MNTPVPKKEVKPMIPAESPAVVKAREEHVRVPETIERIGTNISETVVVAEPEGKHVDVKTPSAPRVIPVQAKVDRLSKEIESILAEDLTDLYLAMPPVKQQEFKIKGEETTSKVRELVEAAKINAKKIFHLIRDWLKMIPGVNRFFLEQEAKIKTDKILIVSVQEQKQKNIV